MEGIIRRLESSLLLVAKAQGRFCVRVIWEKRQHFKKSGSSLGRMGKGVGHVVITQNKKCDFKLFFANATSWKVKTFDPCPVSWGSGSLETFGICSEKNSWHTQSHYWRQKTGSKGIRASWSFVFIRLVLNWYSCALRHQTGLEQGKLSSFMPLVAELGKPVCYRLPWTNGVGWHLMRQGGWTRRKGTLGSEGGTQPSLPPGAPLGPWGSAAPGILLLLSISTKGIPCENCNPETFVPKTAL